MEVLEILKLGLPGLIFLMAVFSYRALSIEQRKQEPSPAILTSIKQFRNMNFLFAALTVAAPILESQLPGDPSITGKSWKLAARTGATPLTLGEAAVCSDSDLVNRYLLLKDNTTGSLVQVRASVAFPCLGETEIQLSNKDATALGWQSGTIEGHVVVNQAPPGTMFVL